MGDRFNDMERETVLAVQCKIKTENGFLFDQSLFREFLLFPGVCLNSLAL